MNDPSEILVATSLNQVTDVLATAEAAVKANKWVAGFVSFEASPAFDPALVVTDRSGTSTATLPLAWFAVYERRHPTSQAKTDEYELGDWKPGTSETEYHTAIGTIREHIRQGRTYQVNHTFRLEAAFEGDSTALYHHLSHAQTCGYGSYLDTGRWVIASASPELFFEWKHGRLVSKPMKGTVRRGTTLADDEAQRQFLYLSEKNRAENLMIVDMVRNDMGRVARIGSVRVPELFTTEKYDTVWQMTSTVIGEPVSGTTLVDVFRALFPSASITGAPKVATMDIISQLETAPRGVYCGTVGFGGPGPTGPEWAFNVAIRTVLIDRDNDRAIYGTGGGITYDSTPGDEFAEALLKTRVLDRRSADLELIETMRWDPDTGFYELARHLERLGSSAWYFDVPLDPAEVRSALGRVTGHSDVPLRLRLRVDRTGWVSVDSETPPSKAADPIRLAIDLNPIDLMDPLMYHKTTSRAVYTEATARHPGSDDVILTNRSGNVTETTIANLAVELDGLWYTPPVAEGLLAGVRRSALIESGELVERPISIEETRSANRVARFNALRGWEEARVLG